MDELTLLIYFVLWKEFLIVWYISFKATSSLLDVNQVTERECGRVVLYDKQRQIGN